ncbi:MAG: hypothetical protein WC734_05920 [Patescibacteria group bacterium]|jgi:hypothetical protein
MADMVTLGLVGGHSPTLGFYSTAAEIIESILSQLEAQVGAHPILRVRMDLNGDGTYEVTEEKKILSISNLSRSIEIETGRPTFGSCDITLQNDDGRYTDAWSKALTYFNPASPTRYHYRPVIVELGFDDIHKWDSAYWLPLFKGYIQRKSEDSASRSVTISLMDEWALVLDKPMAKAIRGGALYNYVDDANELLDKRELMRGTYYGHTTLLTNEKYKKDNQILIPYTWNDYAAYNAAGGSVATYCYLKALTLNAQLSAYDFTLTHSIWFWGWNKDWFTDGKEQWMQLPLTNVDTSVVWALDYGPTTANIWIKKASNAVINFKTASGAAIVGSGSSGLKLDEYFLSTADGYEPAIGMAALAKANYDNPAVILFDQLYNRTDLYASSGGIPIADLDVSSATPASWADTDFDYEDTNYYSFDVSYSYLKLQGCHMAVNTDNPSDTLIDLINDICSLTRGGFFIDKGKDISGGNPIRRVHFVIHQPRLIPPDIRTLTEKRIQRPSITREVTEIRNYVEVSSFDLANNPLLADSLITTETDTSSVAVYGEKRLSLINKPKSNACYLYDSIIYANALAEHYLMVLKEPPLTLEMSTNLIGYTWDLKSLIGIKDTYGLQIDYANATDLSGCYEIYGLSFDTRSFKVSFNMRWAGYLINPSGVLARRYAFADNAYADADAASLEYYTW